MMVYYLGTVIGQLLLGIVSTQLLSVIPWVGALVITAMLPLLFAQFSHQSRHESPPIAVWPMLKRRSARLGINGCIISGVLLGSLYGLLPLYLSIRDE